MELWSVYDKDRKTTGRTVERGDKFTEDKFAENEYHLIVHICIFNSKGEMLIQQRQPFKEGWSNMWDLSTLSHCNMRKSKTSNGHRELRFCK